MKHSGILRSRELLDYLRKERKRVTAAIAVLERQRRRRSSRGRSVATLQRSNVDTKPVVPRRRRRYHGPGREWTRKEHRLLRELYPLQKPVTEIAALLNRTRESVKSRVEKLGLKRGNRKIWTAAEDEILRRQYATESSRSLTEAFACTFYQLYSRAHRLGLHNGAANGAANGTGIKAIDSPTRSAMQQRSDRELADLREQLETEIGELTEALVEEGFGAARAKEMAAKVVAELPDAHFEVRLSRAIEGSAAGAAR